jgi:hypothetical protein
VWYGFEAAQFAKTQKEGGSNIGRILAHKKEDQEQNGGRK